MDFKSKYNEIIESIKNIWFIETTKKYRGITVGSLFILLVLTLTILPKWWTVENIWVDWCNHFKTVISSYNSLPENMKTEDVKKEIEKAEDIVKNQCD